MALQKRNNNSLVKKWQQFLIKQNFLTGTADGDFGPKTEQATKDFQKYYGISQTGVAASLTLGKAYELGFNPDNEPSTSQIKTDKDILNWIKNNLGVMIREAIHNTVFAEDWLAGICCRETGFLIVRYHNQGFGFEDICAKMLGDYSKRPGESAKRYHGYGFWQIDINSYPDFVNHGDWKDPFKTAQKAVSVLEEKRKYLIQKGWAQKLEATQFERAVTAAYNCGQGNVHKALSGGGDVDCYTYANDYSKEVFRYRRIYKSLIYAHSVIKDKK